MNKKLLISAAAVMLVGFFVVGFISIGSGHDGSKTIITPGTQNNVNPAPIVSDLPVIYTDDFDGANDTTSLKARGYKVWYRGTGPQGSTATWYQGQTAVFNAYNGPASGYVCANYSVVTGTNNIDSWLVLPRLAGGLVAGDSLYFYQRSATGSTYPDSIRVMYSVSDSVPEGTWVELGRFKTNTAGVWERKGFRAPSASANGRFAVRYCVVNGGPSGSNSDYIGIDAMTIVRSAAPPTSCTYYSSTWCALNTYPNIPVATYFQCADWVGDTLYVSAPPAGAATNVIYRYTLGGSWTIGVPMPTAKVGGALTAVGGKLYYTGGGASTITTPSTDVYEYTPSTGTWVTKAPLPVALAGHGAGNWGDSVLFVAGGPYTGPSANVYYYRPASNTWGTSSPFTGARRTFGFGISGNKMFVCAGYSGSAFIKTFQIGTIGSNASTITWAAGPDVPTTESGLSRPGGVAINNLFYLIGGERGTSTGYSNITYVWNIPGNSWLVTTPLKPTAMSNIFNGCAAKCVNDTAKIFVPGGYTGAGSQSFEVLGCGPNLLVGVNDPASQLPSVYSLSQNYPNPFNPSTKISFALPQAGNVKIVVFDLLGREVEVLVNEFRTAGNHTVDFNAASLASGVYFYKIEAGDFTATKKMLLIK